MSESQPIQAMEIKSRVQERLAWGLETSCGLSASQERPWSGLIRDLSQGGVGLVLETYVEAGSELTIDIPDSPNHLRVRVVHATALPGGQWLLGCGLDQPLTEDELQKILARAVKA